MGKINRLLVAALIAVTVLHPAAAPAAPARAVATTRGCAATDFPARSVMARAVVSRGCRPAANRVLVDGDESALVVPGAIRADASVPIRIVSALDPTVATPFQDSVTISATGDHGDATVTNIVVAPDHKSVTAVITTPAVEEFLNVVVTNVVSGFMYAALIDVRNATGEFHPVTPTRVFDTRFNSATLAGPAARLAANRAVEAPVAGINGLPANGIDAVAVNITTVDPGADGFLTAWPSQTTQPNASSINYARSRTVANLVTLPLGPDGGLNLASSTATDVILDVVGWYAAAPTALPDRSAVASGYLSLPPERRADTRFSMTNPVNASKFLLNGTPVNGPLHAGETRTLSLDAFQGEFDFVDAVALNVTVSGPTAPGFLTIWPSDQPRPNASSLNFGAGDAIPNMVIVPISSLHQLSFFNSAGNTDVIVDLVGLYETMFVGGLIFESTPPTRIIDSRFGTGLARRPVGANETANVTIGGTNLVPDGADAVVMNAVITDSNTATGFVTVYAAGDPQPNVSNLNAQLGRAASNQVIAPLTAPTAAAITIFNANGSSNIIADVTGFFF